MNGEADYFDNDELTYFNSFRVKHVSDKARKFLDKPTATVNIFRLKEMIHWCEVIFILTSLRLCLQKRILLVVIIYFHCGIWKE